MVSSNEEWDSSRDESNPAPIRICLCLRYASTFPSPLGSKSTVNLHARAPGSQLHNQTAVQARETGLANEYTYDIWGDHFSGLHLLVPKNVASMKSSPVENNFDSFFVRGPQTLVTNSQEG